MSAGIAAHPNGTPATWPIASASFLPLAARTTASQITSLCAVSSSRTLLAHHIPNGGYLCLGADQRELRSVSRFRARRRAERLIHG